MQPAPFYDQYRSTTTGTEDSGSKNGDSTAENEQRTMLHRKLDARACSMPFRMIQLAF